ncbi:MAG: M81 family metallopeptidase [Chromatiales bacterium]|jgi:microcystin degradation protein MlrC|nr:M81 family metallopeptidase [Chromatiales bacterium]
MRLAIAGFSLESVTFLPETTDIADFEHGATRGLELITQARGTNSVLGGMVAVADEENIELVGIVSVNAGAAASASDAAFDKYAGEIVDGVRALQGQIDGCFIYLHGALATPTRRRADADVLAGIREVMGPDFPIAVGMDLHGNLGPDIIGNSTVVAGYYFSPHTDMAQTGERAARMLVATLRGQLKPRMALVKPGIILPSIFSATRLEPLAELIRNARAVECSADAIVDISVFCGFAYADVPDCGMSVLVIADGSAAAATKVAQQLSDKARSLRASLFKRELIFSVSSGLDRAQELAATTNKPICLLEHADRLNDSTYTLREMLDRNFESTYVPFMFDPETANACVAAGKGATLTIQLGGKSSPQAGETISTTAQVLWAGTPRLTVTGPLYTGSSFDLGPTALVRVGRVLVSIISIQWSAIDLDCFHLFDLGPASFRYVLLRSKTHFRHVYEPMCEAIIIIDTPDWGPADVTQLPYQFADRSAFPFTS